jgi:hypothetical protein
LKIAVFDDEKQDLCLICSLVCRYDSSLDLTTFSCAKELLDAYQNTFYDLVFLYIETQLPSVYFAKPHNSYVVNLTEVSFIATNSMQLTNGDPLPISQRNRKAFELALFQYVQR